MLTPAWELLSWPTVWASDEHHASIASKMRHLSTSVSEDRTEEGYVFGQVLFGLESAEEKVGIAWDWVALGGKILAIADPMAIVSNLHFLGEDGRAVREAARILELNNVVNSVPWQRRVRRALPGDTARRSLQRAATPHLQTPDLRPRQSPMTLS